MSKELHESIRSDYWTDKQLEEDKPYWLENIIDEQFKRDALQETIADGVL
jgi:hypothetical protein